MGIVVRQSIITTIISYIGVAIGYVNVAYLYPRFLSPDQIGTMRTIQDAAILLAQFAQFGLAQSIIRFFPRLSNTKEQAHTFFTMILVFAGIAFGLFLLLYMKFESSILSYFSRNAYDLLNYSKLALYLTFTTIVTTLLEVYSRSLLKNTVPNLLREVLSRLLLGILALCYFKNLITFDQVMILSVMIYVFCLTALGSYLFSSGDLRLNWKTQLIPPSTYRDIILFSLLSFAGTAGLIIIAKIDSLMIAGLLGLASVAVYTTSFYIATVIEIPKRAMTQVATPLLARGLEANNREEVKKIYKKTSLNQFILGSLLLMGVAANLDSIFVLMPNGEIYKAGQWVVVIVGTGKLIDMLFGPSSEIIVYSKYYWFNIILIVLLAGLVVTANNLLIPAYGIEGAAMGAAITLLVFNLIKFIFIWVKMELQPFSFDFIKVLFIGSAAWSVHLLIPRVDQVVVDILIRSVAITLTFGSMIFWTQVSPEANGIVKKMWGWVRK